MEMNKQLQLYTQEVNAAIMQYLPEETGYQKTIFEAMNYSMRAGGKRIRPLLMRETYRLFGGTGKEIEPFMAAIEMIHTSSLVHDDLPCMDNDELRRGLPTTWTKYGYDMAVLAGDALLIYAIETAAKSFSLTQQPGRIGQAIGLLAEKTGIYGMIGGQVVDVELTSKQAEVTSEHLDFIYRMKTAALLEASVGIGALLGGADETQLETAQKMATCIGVAFQIQDDILDVTSTPETLGKPIMSDEKNSKTTYVTLNGMEQARADVARISDDAICYMKELPGENPFLEGLIRMLITREK